MRFLKNIFSPIWVMSVLLALILLASISCFGRIQFGGYDGSILINHAWQLRLGYEPYVDIVTGWPPILLIGVFWAFEWWGVHWLSLVNIAAVFSVITFIIHIILLKKQGFTPFLALLTAFTVQSVTMVVISWWWYNNITAVVGVLFLTTLLLLIKQQRSMFGNLSFVVTTTLLMLSKPNVTLALLIPSIGILMTSSLIRRRVIILSLVSLAVTILILLLSHINPINMVSSYSDYAGKSLSITRILRFLLFNSYEETAQTLLALLPGLMALIFVLFPFAKFRQGHSVDNENVQNVSLLRRGDIHSIALGVLSVFVGVWAMMTNNEYNMTDGAFIFFGIMAIFENLKGSLPISRFRIVLTLVLASGLVLSLNAYRYAVLRYRVMEVGIGAFYEDAMLAQISAPPLFDGMFVGPRMVRVLSQINQLLQSYGFLDYANAPVFFGPRIDFGYAAYNIKPYPGLPTWWEFFSQDGVGKTDVMVERFVTADFQLCLFLRDDYTYLPDGLLTYLNENYLMYEQGELDIYVRKKINSKYYLQKFVFLRGD